MTTLLDTKQRSLPRERELSVPYNSSLLVASASLGVGTWLIIGGVAYSHQDFRSSFIAELITYVCFVLQIVMTLVTLTAIDIGWENKGKLMFAAGIVGVGITTALSVSASNTLGFHTMFWSLSGIYIGWLLELSAGLFAYLASLVDRAGPRTATARIRDDWGLELHVDALPNPVMVIPPPKERRDASPSTGQRSE